MKKISLLITISIFTIIVGCKKDNSIGADLLPPDDLLNAKFSDTFSVNVKTIADTFLRTDKLAKNYLGVINDVQFGFQKASIVMELDRPTNIFDDTLGPFVVDSVILFLKYSSVYGDTLTPQSFNVSQINNKIIETQSYYSNNTSFPAGSSIGSLSNYLYTPTRNPVITSITDTVGTLGLVRIPINNSVGVQIFNLGQTTLRDSSLFKNAFNGIVVENSNNNGNAMAEIELGSTNTYLSIFYKNKYGVAKNSKLYSTIYRVSSGTLLPQQNAINLFNGILSSAVQNVVNSGLQNDSINYMLGQGGTLIKVSLPTLSNLGKIAVNKAVLQITQIIPNTINSFTAPPTASLFLVTRNTDGNLDFLPSYVVPFYNGYGVIDSVGTDIFGKKFVRYSINLSKHIQDISKGIQPNTELYIATYRTGGTNGSKNLLSSYNYGYTPFRVVFAGSNYSDARFKMKLNLTYTLIK